MVLKYLCLSTAHVTQKDMDLLEKDRGNDPVFPYNYLEGCFVVLPETTNKKEEFELFCDMINYGYSTSFAKVVAYAFDKKCNLIRLDCDGEILEDTTFLNTNNW